MAASQDKVQAILESLLEDSLPLVHKGIFTTEELRHAMCLREKHENNMLKPTYKLSDYLTAIEFEYELERERKFRIEAGAPTNPLFKKQAKTDFVIIKRIIRLWDRTTHKFKSNTYLWQQYLGFCCATRSKKQFYKALSAALRFNPFELTLWRIGIQYEIEIGLNLWKARKLYIKALKMNPTKVDLWLEMFKFEIHFLSTLSLRQKAIQGHTEGINFIMPEELEKPESDSEKNQEQPINLQRHHELLATIAEQALSKLGAPVQAYFRRELHQILKDSIAKSKDQTVVKVLQNTLEMLGEASPEQKVSVPAIKKSALNISDKAEQAMQIFEEDHELTFQSVEKQLCQFILKPKVLAPVLSRLFDKNWRLGMEVLKTSKRLKHLRLPGTVLQKILDYKPIREETKNDAYIRTQVDRIEVSEFVENPQLMASVIQYNQTRNDKSNSALHRRLSIHCRSQPEVIERCLHLIQSRE